MIKRVVIVCRVHHAKRQEFESLAMNVIDTLEARLVLIITNSKLELIRKACVSASDAVKHAKL